MKTSFNIGRIGLALVSFGLTLAGVWAAQDRPPALAAVRCAQAPVIDGDLADACWQTAAKVTNFALFTNGESPAAATAAYIACDDDGIYLALNCAEPDPKQLRTAAQQRDQSVTADDCVEIFLQPGGSVYYHFAVNAANVQYDQRCVGGAVDRDWNGDWKSATRIGPDHWTVEIAIPFYNFSGDIVPGQSWRLNLGREKRTTPQEISSWAYAPGGFHQPAKFGVLTGVTADFGRFNLVVANLTAGKNYSLESPGYAYLVEAEIQNRTGAERALTIEIEDQPLTGEPVVHPQSLTLAKGERRTVSSKILIPALTPRSLALRIREASTGKLCAAARLGPKDFAPLIQAYLDRSYYTAEPAARVIVALNLPEAALDKSQLNLAVTGQGQTIVEKTAKIQGLERTEIPIEIEKLAWGTYPVTVTVTDAGKGMMGSQTLTLVKLPPGRAGEVKVDQDQIVTLVDGRPFFPVGIYMLPVEQMPTWAEAGFNTVVGWTEWTENASIADGHKYLDAAQAAGLKVIDWPCRYMGRLRYTDAEFPQKFTQAIQETLPQIVKAFRDHPALLAWYTPDEPNLAALKGGEQEMIRLSRDYYQAIKAGDPYHPVYGLFYVRIPVTPGWSETYEIGGVDVYWCPTRGQTPLYVSHWTGKAVAIVNAKRTPLWLVPQAASWSGSGRALNPREQRCQTYLGLTQGAKGIVYFTYPIRYRPLWNELQALAREMNQLAPILLTGTPVPPVSVQPDRVKGNLQVLAREFDGKLYLVAVNALTEEIQANFRITGWTAPAVKGSFGFGRRAPVKVWFENRSRPFAAEGFADTFAGYASHVYELAGQPAGQIQIEVDATIKPVQAVKRAPEVFIPLPGNLIKNPGFEEDVGWTFTDWDAKYHNCLGRFDSGAHAGKRCARIDRTHCEAAAQFVSDPITLESNTRYRLGGYVKSDISEGVIGPSLFLLGPESKIIGGMIEVPGKSVAAPSGQIDWTPYATDVVTGDKPVTVRIYCRLANSIGKAWFDDVFLVKVPPTEVINLLKNSSFEDSQALPGWPVPWNGGGHPKALAGVQFFDEKGTDWTSDDQVVFHGKTSLRMRRTGPASDDQYRLITDYQGGLPVAGGRDYTFSIYLKGDRPGMKVRLILIDRDWTAARSQDVDLTITWQRYTLAWKVPDQVTAVFVRFDLLTPGVLWADAAQFETGKEAHAYRNVE